LTGSDQASNFLDFVNLQLQTGEDLLAQIPAAIGVLLGPDHRWSYINAACVRMCGRTSASDFIGKTVVESLPELVEQGFIDILDEVFRTGAPHVGTEAKILVDRETSGLPRTGYFDFLYQPMRNPKGGVQGIFVHALEVTDKVEARIAIEETAERLRLAQAAAEVGTWEWDPEGNTQRLSPELHNIFGTNPDDPEHAQVWASRVYQPDLQRVRSLMAEGYRTGSMEFEYRYLHPTSGLRWFYCKGSKFQGETRMLGILQDVTARRLAEEASQRLVAIVESSDDAIISKNLDGIVTSWNLRAERMFGYAAAEMIGKPITTIIPAELHGDETRILATIARGERVEHFETERVTKSGERIQVSLTVSPVKDEQGRIIGAAKIARDITQHKKAEKALRTTEMLASVGRLAATVAHEINNPLEAVTNLIYLAKNTPPGQNQSRYLDMAEEELERVSHLTRQTLGFYRETSGATNFRIGALINSLLPVFASRTRNKGIRIVPDIRQDDEIYGIPGEIRQVIANIVSNSVDALSAGGSIRIRVSAARHHNGSELKNVRLTVADSGCGVPIAARPKLFEPFFTTKKDVGTGLGLWVCKSIVDNHRGSIRFRTSSIPGRSYTVFSILLPQNAPQEATEQNGEARSTPESWSARETTLQSHAS
jgi:PAS domain S-box-containing protein